MGLVPAVSAHARRLTLGSVTANTVPDGGTTAVLLGFALTGLGMLRRKIT